jgi:hypothetical protein
VLHPLPGDVTDPPPVELEVGFVGPDGRQVRMGLAEGVPVRFEAVAPVRAFPSFKRQRYFPGLWWSATTRRHVGYESWLERDHLMLLDHDPAVVGIASQPSGCSGSTTASCGPTRRTTSPAGRTAARWSSTADR